MGISKIDREKLDMDKTDASAKGRSAPEAGTTASAESVDDSSEPVRSSGDSKSDQRHVQQSGKDAVRFSKSEPVETDFPPEDVNANSKPPHSANPANGGGLVQNTGSSK